MKKLNEFTKENQLDLKKMSTIKGGRATPSSSTSVLAGSNGCCQLITTTDEFEDCNGNGQWDSNENGSSVSTANEIDCP